MLLREGAGGGAEGLDAGIVLGREKFQRTQRAVLREKLGDGQIR